MSNANPSIDPANEDSLTGTFRHIFNKLLQNVDGMLPATIVSFDRASARAQVQPSIMMLDTNNQQLSRAPIASVPVLQIGGGGYFLSFNLKPGDPGWILACDRDISSFLQSGTESKPNTLRKNNFADSLFIPDIMRNFVVNGEDAEHAVFQTADGSVRIALWPDQVKITAPKVFLDTPLTEMTGNLLVQGNLTTTGATTLNGGMAATGGTGKSVTIVGDTLVTGNSRTVGNIEASGTITPDVP